jgi:MoaA/NifB/PqqE/SkfB family radical SAM enzyme
MAVTDPVKRAALNKLVDYIVDDPEAHIAKMMDLVDKFAPKGVFTPQRAAFRKAIDEKNNWYQLLMRILSCDPDVLRQMIRSVAIEGNLLAWPVQEAAREKYHCNIPWAILLDPTSACNLHCTGCWAAEYGHNVQLTYDEIDSIITQGKELGTHIYIYTGGEPLVRKKDVIKLCEKHQDCAFLCFTNSTLIDEDFIADMKRVKNFIPSISVEGFEAATDSRRGEGTFQKVSHAMDMLREAGLPFGVSCCYTSQNAESIASEEFFDWMIEKGVIFAWIFYYMPVGVDSPTELIASAEQRRHLYEFVRTMRDSKPLFTLDFQNDGEYVGGCIAGGRRYLHINAAGDVEPCVFVHYSNANIREVSLLEALQSPLMMAYHDAQPFNSNYLRPCPFMDNDGVLADMVEKTGAKSTDLMAKEEARDLCNKCSKAIEDWTPVAKELWENPDDHMHERRIKPNQGMCKTDVEKFKRQGRKDLIIE